MKKFFVKKDFDAVTNNEEAKVFQVISIVDEGKNDLSDTLAPGLFFKNDAELANYLISNKAVPPEESVQILEDI